MFIIFSFFGFPFLFLFFYFLRPDPPPATRYPSPATRFPSSRYPPPVTRHPSPAEKSCRDRLGRLCDIYCAVIYFDILLRYVLSVTFCGAVVLKVMDQKTLVKSRQ